MKYLCLAIIWVVVSFFSSCTSCRKTRDIMCGDGMISFRGVGYTLYDLDSPVVLRYKQDNSFDSLVDTITTQFGDLVRDTSFFIMIDTAFFRKTGKGYFNLIPGFDYEMLIPHAGRTYKITN